MATAVAARAGGLEGIEVGETALSLVDGERGRLVLRGHDVEALAGRVGFEDVAGLLLDGRLPDPARREAIAAALGAGRAVAFERLAADPAPLQAGVAMDALRAGVARLEEAADPLAALGALAGAIAVIAAAWWRARAGLEPLAPDPAAPHARDLLRLVTGRADDERAAALDAYLVTVGDHGMNASTFAARVVASTRSDAVSATVAAIGALKGPLHGGAPGPVLDMLDAIGEPGRAGAWIEAELAAGRRIMGMGHRVYRVRDPRAAVLEAVTTRLERAGVAAGRLALARAAEAAAEAALARRHPGRALKANVEFYTAVLLDAIGLPRELFTAVFAAGRVVGWLAHVEEQRRDGRLIRPSVRYVGMNPAAVP